MTGTFSALAAALFVFFVTHSLPSMRGVRGSLVELMGERAFLFVYSAISLAVTGWLIAAALQAPAFELWPMTTLGMWVTVVAMFFAGLFLVWGLVTPNPFSIKIAPSNFSIDDVGLLAITRHPIMWGLALWAFGHLVSNGDAGPAILFTLLGSFALLGTLIFDARRKRDFGAERWAAMTAHTSAIPFAAVLSGRARIPWRRLLGWPTWLAVALYLALLMVHQSVIGVSPLPPM